MEPQLLNMLKTLEGLAQFSGQPCPRRSNGDYVFACSTWGYEGDEGSISITPEGKATLTTWRQDYHSEWDYKNHILSLEQALSILKPIEKTYRSSAHQCAKNLILDQLATEHLEAYIQDYLKKL